MNQGIPVGRAATIHLRNQHMTYAITWSVVSSCSSRVFVTDPSFHQVRSLARNSIHVLPPRQASIKDDLSRRVQRRPAKLRLVVLRNSKRTTLPGSSPWSPLRAAPTDTRAFVRSFACLSDSPPSRERSLSLALTLSRRGLRMNDLFFLATQRRYGMKDAVQTKRKAGVQALGGRGIAINQVNPAATNSAN
jgi:hypothetical protein